DFGIERDLHHLGVPRVAGAHSLVRGMRHVPARIARDHLLDAFYLFEDRLQAPEASAAQRGNVQTVSAPLCLGHPQSTPVDRRRRGAFLTREDASPARASPHPCSPRYVPFLARPSRRAPSHSAPGPPSIASTMVTVADTVTSPGAIE